MKMIKTLLIPVKSMTIPALLSTALLTFTLAGCVTVDQSEQLDTRRELNALNAMYRGILKKVDRIDTGTRGMIDDVEETKTGFASLEVETRSSLAENNAELEKFREEFGFVRGGIEESEYLNKEFNDKIAAIKADQADMIERLSVAESASTKAGEKGATVDTRTRELLNSITKKSDDIETKLENLIKLSTSLERRISALEGKKAAKTDEKAGAGGEKAKELYERGRQHAVKKNYSKAIELLKGFLSANPGHALAGNAQFWLAESYFGREDWERAILEFNKVIKKYPKSEFMSAAGFKQGLSFLRLGSDKEARVIFERIAEKFPDSKEAEEAKKRLKKMDLQKK